MSFNGSSFLGEIISCFSMLMRHYEMFLITVPHSNSKYSRPVETAKQEILIVVTSLVHCCAIRRMSLLHYSYTMLPVYSSCSQYCTSESGLPGRPFWDQISEINKYTHKVCVFLTNTRTTCFLSGSQTGSRVVRFNILYSQKLDLTTLGPVWETIFFHIFD